MKRTHASNCESIFLGLCEHLGEDVHSSRCRTIHTHLRTCSDCRAYLAALRRTIALYKTYPSPRLSQRAHRDLLREVRRRASAA
jgi:hypothetical protein